MSVPQSGFQQPFLAPQYPQLHSYNFPQNPHFNEQVPVYQGFPVNNVSHVPEEKPLVLDLPINLQICLNNIVHRAHRELEEITKSTVIDKLPNLDFKAEDIIGQVKKAENNLVSKLLKIAKRVLNIFAQFFLGALIGSTAVSLVALALSSTPATALTALIVMLKLGTTFGGLAIGCKLASKAVAKIDQSIALSKIKQSFKKQLADLSEWNKQFVNLDDYREKFYRLQPLLCQALLANSLDNQRTLLDSIDAQAQIQNRIEHYFSILETCKAHKRYIPFPKELA